MENKKMKTKKVKKAKKHKAKKAAPKKIKTRKKHIFKKGVSKMTRSKKRIKKHSGRRGSPAIHHDGQVIIMGSKKTSKKRRARSGFLMGGSSKEKIKAIGNNALNVASGVAGGVLGAYLGNMLPIADARLKAGIPAGAGILLASFARIPALKFAGIGLGVMGGLALLRQFMPSLPMLSGTETVVYLPAPVGPMGQLSDLTGQSNVDEMNIGYITQNDL
jgi:hypothetical protein